MISAALLNKRLNFSPSGGQPHLPIKAALLISSLQVSPIGQSSSSRSVISIVLAESLDPHAILEKIWRPCFSRMLSKKEADTLMLTAAMVNNLPRMVESVDTFFRVGNNGKVPIDEKLVSDLFKYIKEDMLYCYGSSALYNDNLIYAGVFHGRVKLNEPGVMEAIEKRFITNSLKELDKTSDNIVSVLSNFRLLPLLLLLHSGRCTFSSTSSLR